MTFNAKMLKRCSAPPENMLNMPSSVPFWVEKNAAKRAASMPGTGMNVPTRYTTNAPNKNHRRLRISAKRVMSPSAAAALVLEVATLGLLFRETAAGGYHGGLGALGRRDHLVFDDKGLGHGARQDDFHQLGAFRHQICLDQPLQRDLGTGHPHQIIERQLSSRRLHRGAKADLRQTALQRHLAAFESGLVVAALARALALHATAAGLALASGRAAADAKMRALGAGAGLYRIQSH